MHFKTRSLILSLIVLVTAVGGTIFGVNHFTRNKETVAHVRRVSKVHPDGMDVSHHQGNIDWQQLSQDTAIQFVYIKATEGTTWQDNLFAHNAREAKKHGIRVGAYHLLSLNTSPKTQVDNYCSMVSKDNVDLIPAVDIEATLLNHRHSDRLKNYAMEVCRLLTERFGRKPIVYTSTDVYNRCLYPEFENYYLWISSYHKRCPVLRGKSHTNIWQYTETGYLENYDKPFDLNCLVNGMTVENLEL